ncbi:MAG: DUF72 domain-containing protein [Steroidobacteraceae bacterium]
MNAAAANAGSGRIRAGIGGWNYEPWRGSFYPEGTPQTRELEYASRQVTAIEINGTFYRLQKPAVYAKWRDETPDDFVFSLKAPRYLVQRKQLAVIGPFLDRFIASGLSELRHKLGPILWQLDPWHPFDAADLAAFLKLLPPSAGKFPLRHALEVRHKSFMTEEFVALAREYGVAIVCVDDAKHPACADLTADFAYVRLRQCAANIETGYTAAALETWAAHTQRWAQGKIVTDLPLIAPKSKPAAMPRDVFVYFINGAKERAPTAAQALIALLS